MKLRKLWMSAILAVMPAVASAQPRIGVGIGVHVDVGDSYDAVAPGDPIGSIDVFYDQLSPYGVWVDEPDVGRVFMPDEAGFVPYTVGYWMSTSVGFVWVSSEPYAWATTHYGRWAFSNAYGRWYWLPDMQWGPAWVDWRQDGDHFGWAPMAPDVVVRLGWQPPVEAWHYCPAARVLDVDVHRYYEPRDRVIAIHRQTRPLEHYSMIGQVRVAVGPAAATLREHHVVVATQVKVEARAIGRGTPTDVRAQATRAQEHKGTFEAQNQQRIDANVKIKQAHVKVIETHPAIKAQVTTRVPAKVEPQPERKAPDRVVPRPPERVAPKPPNVVPQAPERPSPRPERPPARVAPVAPRAPDHPTPRPEKPPVERAPSPQPIHPTPAPPQPRPMPPADPGKDHKPDPKGPRG